MLKTNEIIRIKRNDLGLSQSQLAHEAGVSLPTIQNIEAGKANLSQSSLEQILEVLGLKLQVVAVGLDWNKVVQLGVPLTGVNEMTSDFPVDIKNFVSRLDEFLKTLSLKKEEMLKSSRNWEAFTAFLWALDTHYGKILRRLRYVKKAKFILSQNLEIFELGRLIKLRRIALANVGSFL
ncbi:MAG TPA: helix-turn-helix transcriptional regulator [Pseudobdellovibrionaceae bacterium]|jgi:transcriptional regulator with XRE-family HTH domain